ncbi:adenosylcobinamide-phosphate synthase CbiB [Parahaliea aestuarii]|uniref:Cobalamin biosynthesis protein CobD n=1 Tax=Parahaliea aestuarii TaxID=1852021 RepID=A0A5C9A3M9_9GAMM|nr:adenosylcobinamide-phosphate synthase CbiB [Parahaliea aestuarii]TXS94594.1 cobalamin biosynthesis protein [Parahaliea aestuarii]
MPLIAPTLIVGLLLDALLGEPRRWHPLVGFGGLVQAVEGRMNRPTSRAFVLRLRGALAWSLLVLPLPLALWCLLAALPAAVSLAISIAMLYLCLGGCSLARHARAVAAPLDAGDVPGARQAVARIVSRDTREMDAPAVTRAVLESVLENGSDAVVASLFWFALAGAPGVVLHRLANTLDACWGYRSARFRHFGCWAARADDVLNYIPARCCALAYALAGSTRPALRCWRRQARRLSSPNGGPVMAAGAGALQVWLGGPARYGGEWQQRPVFGCAREARPADIERGLALLWRAVAILLAFALALELLCRGPSL